MPVVPPTEPAVCTRNIGLPVAPSASVRYSSGFMTPSNRSGALPRTTASMSDQSIWASSSARRGGLADEPAEGHVPAAALVVGLADADDRARLMSHQSFPSMTQTRFCCRHGPDVECASVRRSALVSDLRGRLDDADQAGRHDRVRGQRAARRVDRHVGTEPERLDEHRFLVGERGLELGHLDRGLVEPGGLGRRARPTSTCARSRMPG